MLYLTSLGLMYIWKIVLFDSLHPFYRPPTPASNNYQSSVYIYEVLFYLFFQIPHLIEIMQYLSFSVLFHLA